MPLLPPFIAVKRGLEADLPALDDGEPAFTIDSHKLFIGYNGTNYEISGSGGGGGITTLNSQTGATQSFAKTDDTNVTLTITSSGDTHTFALGWTGQLGAARGGLGLDASGATNGQLLIGNGSGLTLAALTAGTGISITNGAGSVTIDATGTSYTGLAIGDSITGGSEGAILYEHSGLLAIDVSNLGYSPSSAILYAQHMLILTNLYVGSPGDSGGTNEVLGRTAGVSGLEWKAITAGTGISITHAAGTITIDATATGADPTASVGLTAVNGTAATFLRSDGAPALDQGIIPTWTGAHTFQKDGVAAADDWNLIQQNTTAATALATVQGAPGLQMIGSAWDTNTLASVEHDWLIQMFPASGNPTTSSLGISCRKNSTGSWVGVFSIWNNGDILFSGDIQASNFVGSSSGTNTGDQNLWKTIAVSGQSSLVAGSATDTLTFAAGTGITITTTPASDTVTITNSVSAPSAATQADQETATSTTTYVSPGRQQYHPSAAKAWVNFTGTGTVTVNASYNVSSITDNGTGDYTVNFSTAFSSANYCAMITGYLSGSGDGTWNGVVGTPTTSACQINCYVYSGAYLQDQVRVYAGFFGDQ